jgi:hypothetical protein
LSLRENRKKVVAEYIQNHHQQDHLWQIIPQKLLQNQSTNSLTSKQAHAQIHEYLR